MNLDQRTDEVLETWRMGKDMFAFAIFTDIVSVAVLCAVTLVQLGVDLPWFQQLGDRVFFACSALAWIGLMFIWIFRPSVSATITGIGYVNPLRSGQVAWTDLASVRPTYSGLALTRKDGSVVYAWAVQRPGIVGPWTAKQKSPLWETRADRIAVALIGIANQRTEAGDNGDGRT